MSPAEERRENLGGLQPPQTPGDSGARDKGERPSPRRPGFLKPSQILKTAISYFTLEMTRERDRVVKKPQADGLDIVRKLTRPEIVQPLPHLWKAKMKRREANRRARKARKLNAMRAAATLLIVTAGFACSKCQGSSERLTPCERDLLTVSVNCDGGHASIFTDGKDLFGYCMDPFTPNQVDEIEERLRRGEYPAGRIDISHACECDDFYGGEMGQVHACEISDPLEGKGADDDVSL